MGIQRTHEQFVQEVLDRCLDVDVLGTYVNSQTPISCKCRKCGLVWKIRPGNLLHGYGCPECGIKKHAASQSKNNGTFILELQLMCVNCDVHLIYPYVVSSENVTCECL